LVTDEDLAEVLGLDFNSDVELSPYQDGDFAEAEIILIAAAIREQIASAIEIQRGKTGHQYTGFHAMDLCFNASAWLQELGILCDGREVFERVRLVASRKPSKRKSKRRIRRSHPRQPAAVAA